MVRAAGAGTFRLFSGASQPPRCHIDVVTRARPHRTGPHHGHPVGGVSQSGRSAEMLAGPWLLPVFLAAGQRARLGLRYVVLRPSLEVALARATGRTGGQLTDPGPITGLHRAFSDLGELERHVIDSSGQTPEQT